MYDLEKGWVSIMGGELTYPRVPVSIGYDTTFLAQTCRVCFAF
jgi:hypothetical protein